MDTQEKETISPARYTWSCTSGCLFVVAMWIAVGILVGELISTQ